MAAQDLHADRMEGAEPRHALDDLADHAADALLHLARRLVGEGDREDLARAGAAGRQDVGDARGQHAGLAGAGAREHQHRTVERHHRFALLRVEIVEVIRLRAAAPSRARRSRPAEDKAATCCHRAGNRPARPSLVQLEPALRASLRPEGESHGLKMAFVTLEREGSTLCRHGDFAADRFGHRQLRVRLLHAREAVRHLGRERRGLLRAPCRHAATCSPRSPRRSLPWRGTAARSSACAWRRNRAAGTSPAPDRRRAARAGSGRGPRR